MRAALLIAVALAGCAGPLATTQPARAPSIQAAAETTAAVLDAIGQAPPATLTRTTIDDAAIRTAFRSFEKTLTIIEAFMDSGLLSPGSPTALRLRAAVLSTQSALNAASAAQRAGSSTSYKAGLEQARIAITNVQLALAGQ
jgi:hypothetical protein